MAKKVKNPKRSQQQQTVAGLISVIVTLVPLILILWLFSDFIELPILWHAALLYLAIDGIELHLIAKKIIEALSQQNKYAVKQHLAPFVLRDTTPLSPLGLAKATIEMQLLRSVQQMFTIGFYFIVFGPLTAFIIRLLFEMHYSWNIKKASFMHFGKAINIIVNVLQWLPVRLFTAVLFLMGIGKNFTLFWRLTKGEFFALSNNVVLASFALIMGVKLSGVAMYENSKLRRKEFNSQGRQPEITDIKKASTLILQVIGFYLVFILAIAGFIWKIQS